MNTSLPPTQRVETVDDDEKFKTIADAKREAKDDPVDVGVNTNVSGSRGSIESELYEHGYRFDNAIAYPQGSPKINKGGVRVTQHADRLLYSWNLQDVNENRLLQH